MIKLLMTKEFWNSTISKILKYKLKISYKGFHKYLPNKMILKIKEFLFYPYICKLNWELKKLRWSLNMSLNSVQERRVYRGWIYKGKKS